MIVLQPPLFCKGRGGHPLCVSGDSSVLMDLHWRCSCTARSSILSIGSVSVAFLARHWWTLLHDDTNEGGLRLLEFDTFNYLVFANTFGHHKETEDGHGIAQMDNTTTRLITF